MHVTRLTSLPRMLWDPERRMVLAGMLDAGMSSLATFVIGVFAAHSLPPAVLGGFALVFSALSMAMIIPDVAIFTPLEVEVVAHPPAARLGLLRHTMATGLLPALLPALLVAFWALMAPEELTGEVVTAFTLTGIACAFLSPIQDHLRRMLHSAGASWLAVVVAFVQLLVAISGILVFRLLDLPVWWAPFGTLAVANLLSLSVGLVLVQARRRGEAVSPTWRWRDVVRSGRWLLLVGLLPTGTGFVVSALVVHFAGPEALGYAETARVVAQPLLVLTTGLSVTLSPKIVAATRSRDRAEARRLTWFFIGLVIAASAAYMAVAGHAWRWNPLVWLVPNAYVITGLAAAMMLAVLVQALSMPGRFEMLGARRERELMLVEIGGNAVRGGIACGAGALGPFAIPWGLLALCTGRLIGQQWVLRAHYFPKPEPGDGADPNPMIAPMPVHVGVPLAVERNDAG